VSVGAQIVTDLLALNASSERSNAQSQSHRSHTIAADTSHTLEPIALHRTICDVVERTKSSISILSADRQADRETPEQSQLTHTQLITHPVSISTHCNCVRNGGTSERVMQTVEPLSQTTVVQVLRKPSSSVRMQIFL